MLSILLKSTLPLLALSLLTACHRFAPAPFAGIGTEILTAQSALDRCTTVTWTMRILDAKTKEDISASLKYRTLRGGQVLEEERAFGPVTLNSTVPLFQIVISQTPANGGLTVNEFTCTATGESVQLPTHAPAPGALRVSVAYEAGFTVR